MATTKKPSTPPRKRPPAEPAQPERPRRGRPPGTGQGASTKKISVTLPLDVYQLLTAHPDKNKSSVVTAALRAFLKKPRRK